MRSIVSEYDPDYETGGLDEVKLDVTSYLKENDIDNAEGKQALAEEIRAKVFEQTRLTVSAGIGPNRMIAKICSDMNKPNG
jgi:DNA polymerase kappa